MSIMEPSSEALVVTSVALLARCGPAASPWPPLSCAPGGTDEHQKRARV